MKLDLKWKDEDKRSVCYYKFNANTEAHGYIYLKDDGHTQLEIEVFSDAVKMNVLADFLVKQNIPVEHINNDHVDLCLRGECVLYKETMASFRDAKIQYEVFLYDFRRIVRIG